MKHVAIGEAWCFGEVFGLRAEFAEEIDTAARATHRAAIERAAQAAAS
ncbi:hypothetical protein ACWEOZ_36000 [Actinoplanes sp. NPDC004185]